MVFCQLPSPTTPISQVILTSCPLFDPKEAESRKSASHRAFGLESSHDLDGFSQDSYTGRVKTSLSNHACYLPPLELCITIDLEIVAAIYSLFARGHTCILHYNLLVVQIRTRVWHNWRSHRLLVIWRKTTICSQPPNFNRKPWQTCSYERLEYAYKDLVPF